MIMKGMEIDISENQRGRNAVSVYLHLPFLNSQALGWRQTAFKKKYAPIQRVSNYSINCS